MAKRKRRSAGNRNQKPLPGWLYLLFGLLVGMVIAYIYYEVPARPAAPPPAPAEPAPAPAKPASPPPPASEPGITFDFYEMLPELDVEVFTDEPAPAARRAAQPARVQVDAAGIYILQAGSFSQLADAKKREGEIALLGISAEIKKGEANGRTVYRVYTNPLESAAEVNRISGLLNANNIETLPKRVK
jgi:cell division protein FtsN